MKTSKADQILTGITQPPVKICVWMGPCDSDHLHLLQVK